MVNKAEHKAGESPAWIKLTIIKEKALKKAYINKFNKFDTHVKILIKVKCFSVRDVKFTVRKW